MEGKLEVGDLVAKKEGSDWGIVIQTVDTKEIVHNRILFVFWTKLGIEVPIREKYMKLLRKGNQQ